MTGKILGVLLTYRRPTCLALALDALLAADPGRFDHLVVVDNDASPETGAIVRARIADRSDVDYVPMERNLGAAGGRSEAMRRLLVRAEDPDWIAFFDDDDPLPDPSVLGRLHAFAEGQRAVDASLGGVGLRGARYDRRRGYPVPVTRDGTRGPIAVDYLHAGFFPLYSVRAVRSVGLLDDELFFGWEELEYGLRLQRAGFSLWMDGDAWAEFGARMGHPPERLGPAFSLGPADARRYYTMRNGLRVARRYAGLVPAARMLFLSGIAKPLLNLPRHPSLALSHLRLTLAAALDASRGSLGESARWPNGIARTGEER
jgi:glycosyltransferase involved in cell wall biosynthesis